MQIVLSILQVLGWILFAIILVLILVIAILLFHPVRYLVNIHWLEEQWAKFQAHWFFHLIRVKISYNDDLVYGEVHLFWKKITFSFDITEKKEDEEETDEKIEKKTKQTSEEGIISKIKGMIERIKEVYSKVKKILQDEKNKEAITHLKN